MIFKRAGEVGGILAARGEVGAELAEFLGAVFPRLPRDADEAAFFAEFEFGFREV